MNRYQASLLRVRILGTHRHVHPQIRIIGNGEFTLTIYWQGECIYLWDHEEWTWFHDNFVNPIPYHSPASQRGSHTSRKAAQLEVAS